MKKFGFAVSGIVLALAGCAPSYSASERAEIERLVHPYCGSPNANGVRACKAIAEVREDADTYVHTIEGIDSDLMLRLGQTGGTVYPDSHFKIIAIYDLTSPQARPLLERYRRQKH